MTITDVLAWIGGLGGSGLGARELLRFAGKFVDKRRGRAFAPPDEIPVVQQGPRRSLSPSAVAAVVDDRRRTEDAIRAEERHTILLERIADAVERIPDTLAAHKEAILEDVQKTRHGIRSDLQTLRVDMAGMACRAPGPPLPPPRGRMPSRPGGE